MKVLIEVIIIVFGVFSVYLLSSLVSQKKHKLYEIDYAKSFNKGAERIKRYSFFVRVQLNIIELKGLVDKPIRFLNLITITTVGIIIAGTAIFFTYGVLKVISTSVIIGCISFFVPFYILKKIVAYKKQKILNMFPTYALTLKNYTQVTNDIIIAFRKSNVEKPLKKYIDRFNISCEKGVNIYECFEELKKGINILKISDFVSALQTCYLKGGDFSMLLDKYSKIITKIIVQQEKEKEQSFASKFVLLILIVINIYLVFAFLLSNSEYSQILTNTLLGKTILNINILSYVIMFLFIKKLNEMEE